MSSGNNRQNGAAEPRTRRTLTLTRRAPLYGVLWLGALIFTQALRSSASNLFFTFVIILPPASLIYLLAARRALNVQVLSERGKVEKLTPYSYDFHIINESIVPFPFVEAIVVLPQSNAVRCTERTVLVSLSPNQTCEVKNTVRFRFRGTYEIGVRCFYAYDLFRIFRMRIDIDNFESVEVLPRRLEMAEDDSREASDSAKRTVKLPNSYDKLEVSDVREYRMGDTLKSIHWNLSSKSEDLVVRDYNTGTTDLSCIFCDMNAHFPDDPPDEDIDFCADKKSKKNKKDKKGKKDKKSGKDQNSDAASGAAGADSSHLRLADDVYYEDMNEFCADGVVELTIAAVLRELHSGSAVRLLWFDSRATLGAFAYEFHSVEDFELLFDLFATAPVVRGGNARPVTDLAAMLRDPGESRSIYVVPALDDNTVAALCGVNGASNGEASVEVMLYDPAERYADEDEHRRYIEGCRVQLAESGAALSIHSPEASVKDGDENV